MNKFHLIRSGIDLVMVRMWADAYAHPQVNISPNLEELTLYEGIIRDLSMMAQTHI